MLKLNDQKFKRVAAFKDFLISRPPGICSQRLRWYTLSYQKYQSQPAIIRRAMALRDYLLNVPLFFDDFMLIPGDISSHPRWAAVYPEYSWKWVFDEIDGFDQRKHDRFTIMDEIKSDLRELLPWWEGKSLYERVLSRQPREVLDAAEIGILSWTGQATSGEGHIVVDHEMALKLGFKRIGELATEYRQRLDLSEPDSLDKREFYEAVEIACEGVVAYGRRLEDFLTSYAAGEMDKERCEEILSIAEDLHIVSASGARTFRQALLTVWFCHMIQQMESNGHSVSLGRFDQYLFPYYQDDINSGRINEQEALEWVEHFYLKLFSIIKLRPEKHSRTQSGYPMYQNLVVGGQTINGKDATNELSYLCLAALAEVRLSEPNFYIRLHNGTPDDFIKKAIQVVSLGIGMPAFVNDEIIIQSLQSQGVARMDALNYSSMGCLEVQVPGKWGYRANGKSKVNALKIMEVALHGGKDPFSGKMLFSGKGKVVNFSSFDQVLTAWRDQLEYYTRLHVIADNIIDHALCELVPNAFCSVIVQDCLKNGKHLNQGGAIYDMTSGALVGIPNVGNVLAALKKGVFEDRTLTMQAIMEAIENNYEGFDHSETRQILLNRIPKYGEDEDYVDELTALALDDYCQLISKFKNMRYGKGPVGGTYYASTVTISANITAGDVVGATPDGRKAHEPTADGISPAQGSGKKGPTAIIHSVSKLPTIKVTGGQLLNIRLQNNTLKTDGGINKLVAILRSLVEMKNWHVQFNTISTDVLRDAILHPENHRDLIVRVAGYSALFVALDPALQMDIISRIEHELA